MAGGLDDWGHPEARGSGRGARRRRRRDRARSRLYRLRDRPNEEWAIDFKGWFRTGDGTRCDPLTLTDAASRYLIDGAHRASRPWRASRSALERFFGRSACPSDPLRQRHAVRLDGAPVGSRGLSVWWLKLGIEPRYIPPSSSAGQRPARAHAPHTEGRDVAKPAAAKAGRAAGALRRLPPALQRGASARGARADAAGDALAAAGACAAGAARRSLVRRRP